MNAKELLLTGGSSVPPTYVDDVFLTYLYATGVPAPVPFDIGEDSDPDWAYVKRYTPCIFKGHDLVTKTNLGGNPFSGGIGAGNPVGGSRVVTYCDVTGDSTAGASDDFRLGYNNPAGMDWNVPWCIECFVKVHSDNGSATCDIYSTSVSANRVNITANYNPSGRTTVAVDIRKDSVSVLNIANTDALSNTWTFISVSYTGSALQVHVNGVLKTSVAFTGWATKPPESVGQSYSYGCSASAAIDSTAFAGICMHRMTFGSARTADRLVVPTRPFPSRSGQAFEGLLISRRRNALGSSYAHDPLTHTMINLEVTGTLEQSSYEYFDSSMQTFEALGDVATWMFKCAPKFLAKIRYAGNSTNRLLTHNLATNVGLVMIVPTGGSTVGPVVYWHSGLSAAERLDGTASGTISGATAHWNSTAPTSSQLSLGTHPDVNGVSKNFVAYLFANDTSPTGLIRSGTVTTDLTGAANVDLGWEPQWVLIKRIGSYGAGGNTDHWLVLDINRKLDASGVGTGVLQMSNTASEFSWDMVKLTSTGFQFTNAGYVPANATFAYIAIRRSNKPPTAGTQVYNAVTYLGNDIARTVSGVGFPPDLVFARGRGATDTFFWTDRLRGGNRYNTSNTSNAEALGAGVQSFLTDGFTLPAIQPNQSSMSNGYIAEIFRRAVGVFDVVCYTGTGADTTITHGLGIAPELIIIKDRTSAAPWVVYCALIGATNCMYLNMNNGTTTNTIAFNSTSPTSTVFTVGTSTATNTNTENYVAYLFATKAGISKVGTYTGNGSSQNIDCGFTAGARFVLIKRTDTTGDWYVWDTVRGIVAASDPHLSLNTVAAEVTNNDSIDPLSSGFIVNQVAATNINVSAATYIFLAFA